MNNLGDQVLGYRVRGSVAYGIGIRSGGVNRVGIGISLGLLVSVLPFLRNSPPPPPKKKKKKKEKEIGKITYKLKETN